MYDRNGDKIGALFPRRAKQLVIKGRAEWLEEGRSLQLIKNASLPTDRIPSEFDKEEIEMEDEVKYTNDGTAEETDASDNALMELARANVQDKQNLIRHCTAFLLSLPMLIVARSILTGLVAHPALSWLLREAERIQHNRGNLEIVRFAMSDFAFELEHVLRWSYTHPVFYMLVGIVAAWGVWIVLRISKRLRIIPRLTQIMRNELPKKEKPDPVQQEYRRLKALQLLK
ncbi:MAG: hypothetical protein FWB87_10830 [Defluviitaleaceae bacterium]|nr:hypothetical protein [Defluviitaleaceae bacterium]MCL2261980.1 hypothetical protein [Defluviitaleaceae bacterium]